MNNNILETYKGVFELTKYYLFPDNTKIDYSKYKLTIGEWDNILFHARIHGLYSFVAQSIINISKEVEIPKQTKINCSLQLEKREKRYNKIVDLIKEIGRKLKAENTNMLILKGLSISKMYKTPYMRDFGDLDCYLMGNYEVLHNIFEKEGIKIKGKKHKHSSCYYKKLSIENHRNILNIDIYNIEKSIQQTLLEINKETEENPKLIFENDIEHNNIYAPTANFNAIYLLRHSLSHFIAGNMPFKHLTDWAMFLQLEYDNINKEKIKDLYNKFNMERVAGAFCYLCVNYIGMDSKYSLYSNYNDYAEFAEKILLTTIESNLLAQQKSPGGLKHIMFKWKRLKRQSVPYEVLYGKGFWREKAKNTIIAYIKSPNKMLD